MAKTERAFAPLIINEKAEKLLKGGHVWVYGEEIVSDRTGIENGSIVDVYSKKNKYLGSGFYNAASKIAVRILSANTNERFDDAFFERRVRYALDYRKTVMNGDLSCTRLIFGDADLLPGLIVDKFSTVLVTQIMCCGTEQRKAVFFTALLRQLREMGETITAIYERNDVAVRKKEGLPLYCGYYAAEGLQTEADGISPEVTICENGIFYEINYVQGQKTGSFLDQKFNRLAAASIANGKTVLDCFTHTGAFALNCAKAGAKHVTALDISEEAIANCKKNALRNGITNVEFRQADVFDYLTALKKNGPKHPFDYIILDPPAFTKSSGTVRAAYRGYKEINLKAMQLLPRGGYLATCSCSHFMTDSLFRQMLLDAALDANVQIRIIEGRKQAKDHPILLGVDETEYLKFYLLQII